MEVDLVEKEGSYPSAVIDFFVEQRIILFIRPWLTITSKESKSEEGGRSVIRSQETCWKGHKVWDLIGVSGGMVGWVFDLFCWHVTQPLMYLYMYCVRPSHQNSKTMS